MGRRAAVKSLPSQEALRGLFHYDPETGVLTWNPQPHKRGFNQSGNVAGTISKAKGGASYLTVGIDRKYYLAHRLIWKMVTGEDPDKQIDHIDGDRLNNRFANFRLAGHGENIMNTAPRSKSGFKGVYHRPENTRSPWVAVVAANKRQHKIGSYSTPEEAATARHAAAVRLQGEFARTY